jgi:3'-phosphoadenosine 5'-phosphosulfate sulfotransferase (PAPS reductase)/FAD synthetase
MQKNIISFSGGKDSTAMLLMMIEKREHVDEIVFFDGGWEFPEMLRHIDKVEQHIGRPITRLYPEKSFDYYLSEHVLTTGPNKGARGYRWPWFKMRWCTRIKIRTIQDHLKQYGKENIDYIEFIGIAADEIKRVKNKKYPLVEWGVTEKQALEYCYSKGFDWEGLYNWNSRVSCFCCPLQGKKRLFNIYKNRPELIQKMLEMDRRIYSMKYDRNNRFCNGQSLSDIIKDFCEFSFVEKSEPHS